MSDDTSDAKPRHTEMTMSSDRETSKPGKFDLQQLVFAQCERNNGGCACKVSGVNLASSGFGAGPRGARCDERYDMALSVLCAVVKANSEAAALHHPADEKAASRAPVGVVDGEPCCDLIANAIHDARWPNDGRSTVQYTLLAESGKSDNEYAYRLADGVLRALASFTQPDRQYVRDPYKVEEGWRLVPVEPTPEMLDELFGTPEDYADMLRVAPTPAATPSGAVSGAVEEAHQATIVGKYSIEKLLRGEDVVTERVTLIPASDITCEPRLCLAAPQDHGAVRDAALEEAADAVFASLNGNYSAYTRDGVTSVIHALKTNTDKPGREGEGLDGWQPIETAPKDYQPILVAFDNSHDIKRAPVVAAWDEDDGCWFLWSSEQPILQLPTHWRPLPAPPAPSDAPRQDGEPRSHGLKGMTDAELTEADIDYRQREKGDWEGGGSPRETFYEIWSDVVDEMKRRGLPVPSEPDAPRHDGEPEVGA